MKRKHSEKDTACIISSINDESKTLKPTDNPYLALYKQKVTECEIDFAAVFDPNLDQEIRSRVFNNEDDDAAALQYSWAIPDERALQIIKHYGPIVEMGAGKGYWARLLQLRGVDVTPYDLNVTEDDDSTSSFWTNVTQGTPTDLKNHSDKALLLCYPDDFEHSEESMALECLDNYAGNVVIHVGELLGDQTLCLPDPWGRTSAPEFQTRLTSTFHKVLQVPLPSWHSSNDSLTVWKRTTTCFIENSETGEVEIYAHIPKNERTNAAAVLFCNDTKHLV